MSGLIDDHFVGLHGVSRSFGGVLAVNDVSLSISSEGVTGLVGPNGAGKTTLLNLISGIDKFDSGEIFIGGIAASRLDSHEFCRLGIARTFQNVKIFGGLSVLEHVEVGLDLRRNSQIWQMVLPIPSEVRERREVRVKALEILERLGLVASAQEPAENLSYGDQRRVEIARALASGPKLLLLDEPTAGMNKNEATAMGNLLGELCNDGLSVLVVEHNIGFVKEFCSHLFVMNFGELIAEGSPIETFDLPAVRDAYIGKSLDERIQRIRSLKNSVRPLDA